MAVALMLALGSTDASECSRRSIDEPHPDPNKLAELSIEQLMEVTITSLYKKPQTVAESPAPVFVITRDDIRRSGVTSIADALRMAPGIQVARINSHAWAVSARGFNGFFSNQLLVLIDGRNVYSTTFSGVSWELDDTLLEDIERIEVIRGPGSVAWGSNAVNGVINIITRCSGDTTGVVLSARAGTIDRGHAALRYGGRLADQPFRIYLKGTRREGYVGSGRFDNDAWDRIQGGFRTDLELGSRDSLRISADVYDGKNAQPNQLTFQPETEDVFGGNVVLAWTRQHSENSHLSLQSYFDHRHRKSGSADILVNTFDIDFQHRMRWGAQPNDGKHELSWGFGYRRVSDEIQDRPGVRFSPSEDTFSLRTAFVQNEFRFLGGQVRVSTGAKLEDNDFTGLEVQPSLRALWVASENLSVWGAVSRAVHLPSRANRSVTTSTSVPNADNPFLPTPFILRGIANNQTDSTKAIFFELGARGRLSSSFIWDATVFRAEYHDVLERELITTAFDPGAGAVVSSFTGNNDASVVSRGLELAATLRPSTKTTVQAAYTYLILDATSPIAADVSRTDSIEGRAPRHQFSIRPSFELRSNLDLDLWFRYVSALRTATVGTIDSYLTMDARLAWRLSPRLELSVVGQNLFDNRRLEFGPDDFNRHATSIERSAYLQLRWDFN